MLATEPVDKFRLEAVGVLIFVDEDVLKLLLVLRGDILAHLEQLQRLGEQIVEIEGVGLALAPFIGHLHTLNLRDERHEVAVLARNDLRDWSASIDGIAEDIRQHLALGKTPIIRAQPLRATMLSIISS